MAPVANAKKVCKGCKSKVVSVYYKCIRCENLYHKSCAAKIKQLRIINEEEVICDKHGEEGDTSEQESDTNENIDSENENRKFVEVINENKRLNMEVTKLKQEIEYLKIQIRDKNALDKKQSVDDNNQHVEFQNKVSEMFNLVFDKLNAINQKIENNGMNKKDECEINNTYAKALINKEKIIVKPKNMQSSDETLRQIKQTLNPESIEVGISSIKQLKNGSLVVGCANKNDLMKLQCEVKKNIGNEYTVDVSRLRRPKIKIIGMSNEISENKLKECIEKQNSKLKEKTSSWKVNTIKKMKTKYMAILEVDASSFKEIMSTEILNIQWDRCPVFEYIDVLRCYGCGGYNHMSKNCKIGKLCLSCGDSDHLISTCPKETRCMNCHRENVKSKSMLDIDHSIFDVDCSIYRRQIQMNSARVDYNHFL